jgi:hypothetical protein
MGRGHIQQETLERHRRASVVGHVLRGAQRLVDIATTMASSSSRIATAGGSNAVQCSTFVLR